MTPRSGNRQRISGDMKPWLRGRMLKSSIALATVGVLKARNACNIVWSMLKSRVQDSDGGCQGGCAESGSHFSNVGPVGAPKETAETQRSGPATEGLHR